MDSVQTQTFSIRGDRGGEAYIDFCDGQLCVSVVIEDKQADFHFDPVTLGMFAHAYKWDIYEEALEAGIWEALKLI